MGVGKFLIDFKVMETIRKARLYWNPLRTQQKLFAFQLKWPDDIKRVGQVVQR